MSDVSKVSDDVTPASVPAASQTPVPAKATSNGMNFVLACVFLDMLAIGLAVPVMPILVGEFVDGKEAQAHWFGIMAMTFGLMQFICMPLLGALSDKIGRKPVLLLSMIGMGLNFLITAWAPTLLIFFIGRFLGGATSASMSTASAYASDVSTPETRAKTFGKIGAAFGLGFICGPFVGGLLGSQSLHLPFYVGSAICFANAVFGYFVLKESLPLDRRMPFTFKRANPFSAIARLSSRKDIRGLVVVFALASAAQMLQQTTWVLYTHFRFGWGPKENGIALFLVGLSAAVVQAGLLGMLVKRFGERNLSIMGLASGAIISLLYGLVSQGWVFYVLIICNFLAFAAGPALQSIVSRATDPREQGALMGSLQSIGSLATVIMPLIGTWILAKVSYLPATDLRGGATFYLCALFNALAVYMTWRYFKTHKIVDFQASKPPEEALK